MANANPIPKVPKHGKELAQRARAGILNAFGAVEKRGVKISDALADAFLADPLKFMDMAAKYVPKSVDQPLQHVTNAIQLSDEQLLRIIDSRKQGEKQIDCQVIEPDMAQLVKKDSETDHY